MRENKEKKNWFKIIKSKAYIISIVIVSLGYIFYGLFDIEKTGKSAIDIIGSCATSLLIGISLTTFLRKEGFRSGRQSDIFQSSLLDYADAKEDANKNYDKLPMFCSYKTEQEINEIKREVIVNANLKYSRYITGYYEQEDVFEKLEDYQKKAIKESYNTKVKPYQTKELLSDLPNNYRKNGKHFGIDENEYIKNKAITSILIKVVLALISGCYTLAPLNTGNISQSVWNAIQIAIWLLFGCIDYINAKEFVINDYRQTHIIQKSSLLKEFNTLMINNPHKLDKYDDEQIYQEFLKRKEVEENGDANNDKKEKE